MIPRARVLGVLWLLATAAAALSPAAADAQSAACQSKTYRVASRSAVAGVAVGGNLALYEYFRRAWWAGEKRAMWINWEQGQSHRDMDKLGHAWGGFHLARLGSDLLSGACVSRSKAVWLGASYAAAFQLQLELWDGRQADYGFSPPDLIANTLGTSLAVGQHYSPRLRAVKPTISYARTAASHRFGRAEGSELRPTTDYAGQTYWLSFDVNEMLPDDAARYWPDFVRASVGHSITDYISPETGRGIRGRRELVLSLDVDPSKLPGDHPVWRRVKHELSYYHFPAPALVLTPSVRGVAWYR